MPEILRLFGMRFFFYSNEHLPIHIHVQNANGRAKFTLQPKVKMVLNQGLRPSDVKLAESIIEENKTLLIKSGEEFHG